MSVLLSPTNTAFRSWKAACDQLTNAINTYTTACTNLQSTLYFNQPSVYEDRRQFEAAILEVEAEIDRLELRKQALEDGVHSLRKTRNLSLTLIPINMLPPSLLLSVFSLLIDHEYAEQTYLPQPPRQTRNHPALTVSSVCTSWRNLALESPTVWSTILFYERDREYLLGQVSLTRAGNAPLDIRIMSPAYTTSHSDLWLLLLSPRYRQIRSLDLVLSSMDGLGRILALWPQDSPASSLKTLSVKIIDTVFWDGKILPKIIPDGAHARFLSITSFRLYGGYFDWDSAAFTGLEHLQVAWVEGPGPTLSQLIGTLRASPRLRTLCLAGVPIAEGETQQHQPIHLVHLEKLSLMEFTPSVFRKLVPLLFTGSLPLALHTDWSLHFDRPVVEVFLALFRRSNVESIYFHHRVDRQSLPEILAALPRLRRLYCSRSNITNILKTLSLPLNNPGTPTGSLPCPQLRAVYFRKCKVYATNRPLLGPITNQPTLVVKFQDCELSSLVPHHLSGLSSGEVQLEFTASDLPHDPPLDGVDYTCVMSMNVDRETPDHDIFHIHLNS